MHDAVQVFEVSPKDLMHQNKRLAMKKVSSKVVMTNGKDFVTNEAVLLAAVKHPHVVRALSAMRSEQ